MELDRQTLANIVTNNLANEVGRMKMALIEKDAIIELQDKTINALNLKITELERSLPTASLTR